MNLSDEYCLPEGWALPKLGDVLTINYGKGLKQSARIPGPVPVYGSNGIVGDHDQSLTHGPALVIGRKGTVGAVHYASTTCWPIDTAYFIDDFRGLDPIYLLHALRSLDLAQLDTSTAIPGLNRGDAYNQRLPIPPIAEQHRIVAKVEELLEKASAARERLQRVPAILKRFRQSVLSAACSGRLTEDWREEHPDVEPASQLLRMLRCDVLERLEKRRDRNNYEFMFEHFPPNSPEGDLPATWLKCSVGHLGSVSNGSTPSRKRPDFWGGFISWVSSGEVQNNRIYGTRETISKLGFVNSSVRILPVGTVLIAMIGEGKTRGQSAILQVESTINQNIAAVDLSHNKLLPEYLWYWFQLQYGANREKGSGTAPPALNCQRVRELPCILPPLHEQQEIVRRVESILVLARAIEQRVAAAMARAEKLPQAILTKAFWGELVPTETELARSEDRTYEPASELLQRIKKEKSIVVTATHR